MPGDYFGEEEMIEDLNCKYTIECISESGELF